LAARIQHRQKRIKRNLHQVKIVFNLLTSLSVLYTSRLCLLNVQDREERKTPDAHCESTSVSLPKRKKKVHYKWDRKWWWTYIPSQLRQEQRAVHINMIFVHVQRCYNEATELTFPRHYRTNRRVENFRSFISSQPFPDNRALDGFNVKPKKIAILPISLREC
jgi:hypothetical protein